MIPKGILIPIGGNENKGTEVNEKYQVQFIEHGILSRVVKESGGADAKIVVIPTASSIPKEVGRNYLDAFAKLGCSKVTVLRIKSAEEAEMVENINHLKEANCVMFSGGDQTRIARKIAGTLFHEILVSKYMNESNFVIAGTSAGAMAMSDEMIAGGSSKDSFVKGAVKMRKGLGLLPGVIFDTHFITRGRFGRISEAVAHFPESLGIGLAEDTGLVIKNGNDVEVIGSGMVIVFDGREIKHNNQHVLRKGTPMTLTNLKVHVLAIEDKLNLETREVVVLPIGPDFKINPRLVH